MKETTETTNELNLDNWILALELLPIDSLIRALHFETKKIDLILNALDRKIMKEQTEAKTKKRINRKKVPVKIGDQEYPSICQMMKANNIQDRGTTNWSTIRNSLKESGKCNFQINKDQSVLIVEIK